MIREALFSEARSVCAREVTLDLGNVYMRMVTSGNIKIDRVWDFIKVDILS